MTLFYLYVRRQKATQNCHSPLRNKIATATDYTVDIIQFASHRKMGALILITYFTVLYGALDSRLWFTLKGHMPFGDKIASQRSLKMPQGCVLHGVAQLNYLDFDVIYIGVRSEAGTQLVRYLFGNVTIFVRWSFKSFLR